MTDDGSVPGDAAAARIAALRARPAPSGKPAVGAKILTAGLSGTMVLGITAYLGWSARAAASESPATQVSVPVQPEPSLVDAAAGPSAPPLGPDTTVVSPATRSAGPAPTGQAPTTTGAGPATTPPVATSVAPIPVAVPAAKPAATKPAATKPATTKPATTKPAATKPAAVPATQGTTKQS